MIAAASVRTGRSLFLRRLQTSHLHFSAAAVDEDAFRLSHPATVDGGKKERGRIVCVTSGKGKIAKHNRSTL
jgi:hypothetical protein